MISWRRSWSTKFFESNLKMYSMTFQVERNLEHKVWQSWKEIKNDERVNFNLIYAVLNLSARQKFSQQTCCEIRSNSQLSLPFLCFIFFSNGKARKWKASQILSALTFDTISLHCLSCGCLYLAASGFTASCFTASRYIASHFIAFCVDVPTKLLDISFHQNPSYLPLFLQMLIPLMLIIYCLY